LDSGAAIVAVAEGDKRSRRRASQYALVQLRPNAVHLTRLLLFSFSVGNTILQNSVGGWGVEYRNRAELFGIKVSHSLSVSMPAAILPLIQAAPEFGQRGALIGLDLGSKTIGVATSDPDRRLATGVETISRTTFTADARRLLALAAERRATGFVLGLPINMDGSEGPRAQSTRAFARNLAKLTALPIGLWDERLSTAAVERDLIAADVSRRKRAAIIDEHAAVFILQGALDRLANAGPTGANTPG
jgi:putative Holliday junction resolvase